MAATNVSDIIRRKLEAGKVASAAGNLTVAEIASRDVLDLAPENAEARRLLDKVLLKVGPVAKISASPEHFLVIKSWGCGFWSDLNQLLGSFLLAEITGRTPVTDWGKGSLYGDGTERDAFLNYFHPVSKITTGDISGIEDATFFPPKWNRFNLTEKEVAKWRGNGSRLGAICFLNRPERVAVVDFFVSVLHAAPWIPADHPLSGKRLPEIYRYLIERYLHPRDFISTTVEGFFRAHLSTGPYVAIHLRGSDKFVEQNSIYKINERECSALSETDPSYPIFLLTDDEGILAKMKGTYGERIITTNCQRSSTSLGTHHTPTVDPIKNGMEILVDTLLALRADRFIGCASSNVAAMIGVMRHWEPDHCLLLGPSNLCNRHLSVFHIINTKPAPRPTRWSKSFLRDCLRKVHRMLAG